MTFYVCRTCTEIGENGTPVGPESARRPLEEFRGHSAYVLLGAPGAGKTRTFKREASEQSECYVSARDFLTYHDKQEWREGTLFIDGLDEVRAGSENQRTPLDKIRSKLEQLGSPRFRLSCRDADWFGNNDRSHLKQVSPDGKIKVLRLDPLSNEDFREILCHSGIADADEFVMSAREKGLDALLTNPQSLTMLANAVAGGNWPGDRKEAFELAARTLFREHNTEHRTAKQAQVDIPQLMGAAGRLCAIQLLTGSAGYDLIGDQCDEDYPGLENIPGNELEVLRYVLTTKLFEVVSEGRPTPVHRHTAEFLAGRYLAELIDKGIPVRRVLALMTGQDGVVVSELRGLSAWLAAHSKPSRSEVIERDPLGTVLYGDVREFSIDEKLKMLDCLGREARGNPWFLNAIALDPRLGDLATPKMAEAFRDILKSTARDDAHQSFVALLIESLQHGEVLGGIADLLMRIIRDDQWWPGIRRNAISAFIRQKEGRMDELKELLLDVTGEVVPDYKDDLLGQLLAELYPATLSPTEILQCLRKPKRPNNCPQYQLFWTHHVPKNSTPRRIAELLDGFVARYERLRVELRPGHEIYPTYPKMRLVPLVLLSRFLEISDEEVEPDRLFDWLGVASWVGEGDHTVDIEGTEAKSIRCWLSGRPEVQKSLIAMGLEHCISLLQSTSPGEFSDCLFMEERRRFWATPGQDFGAWYLAQAIAATDQQVAEYFIRKTAELVSHSQSDGFSREVVEERIGGDERLLDVFNKRLDVIELYDGQEEKIVQRNRDQERQTQHKWRDRVKPHQVALRENKGQPALLCKLAKAYLGGFHDVRGNTPRERMTRLLGNDDDLIEAVLEGFRLSMTRSDLPSDVEVIKHRARNQIHHLVFPFMAGLEEFALTTASGEVFLDDGQMRLALAIHYNVPLWVLYTGPDALPADQRLAWYKLLLTAHPEVVSDVLVRSARSKLRNGEPSPTELYQLAFDKDHAEIARLATLPLLAAYPVRCTAPQLLDLSYLLWSALRHCDEKKFLILIETKLGHRSMTVAQRVYWLTAGLVASPELYREKLESYVSGKERRVQNLAKFITGGKISPSLMELRDVTVLQLLIRLMGSSYRPYDATSDESEEGDVVTPVMTASIYVQRCIDHLASMPSDDACAAFDALLAEDSLSHWQLYLKNAADKQRGIRRESIFHHSSIGQVLQTLDNRKPANAADLAALVFDNLHDISVCIRNGNTSDWRQYWNVDSHNRPKDPKPEDACRDALLSDLRLKLGALDIDVQPEGRYADDKRSDIRVSYGGFNVPVEIKKNSHQELWRAIKSQLIAKYTRDPGADGYGIYLVFWFGKDCLKVPGPNVRPSNAKELEGQLRDSLTEMERRKVSVCVIDVSEPRNLPCR